MRTIELAMTVVTTPKGYLLQRRSSNKMLGAANLIGCLGGMIEVDETPMQAAVREIGEESSLALHASSLTELGEFTVQSDRGGQSVNIHAYVFNASISHTNVELYDGEELLLIPASELLDIEDQLTPATRKTFKELLGVI